MSIKHVLTILLVILVSATVIGAALGIKDGKEDDVVLRDVTSVHDFVMQDIDGNDVDLKSYRGQVLLLVNVASKCGYTYQYEGLQKLYEAYADQGFVILGFPANNFARQEPGSEKEIKQFCSLEYGVTFPMFSKISVKGSDLHPLYRFLTDEDIHPETGGKISWNFNKFVVDAEGKVQARFGTKTEPDDPNLIAAVEKLLQQP